MAFLLEIIPNGLIGTTFPYLVLFAGAFTVQSAVNNCDVSNFPEGKFCFVFFRENMYVRQFSVRYSFNSMNFYAMD